MNYLTSAVQTKQTLLLSRFRPQSNLETYKCEAYITQPQHSHYLKCKGEMEALVKEIGFEKVVFLKHGANTGKRAEHRLDERLLQGVIK